MDLLDLARDMPRLRVTPADAARARVGAGQLSARLMQHGSMVLHWYAPRGQDLQRPHDRDELYFIASGTAGFSRATWSQPFGQEEAVFPGGEEWVSVAAGDVLFVPAGTWHRFDAMSEDFGAWLVFYGPEGGEAAQPMPEHAFPTGA